MRLIDKSKVDVEVVKKFIGGLEKVEKGCSGVRANIESFKSAYQNQKYSAFTDSFIAKLQVSFGELDENTAELKDKVTRVLVNLQSTLTRELPSGPEE